MTDGPPSFRYDLFFVCAGADRDFVQRDLLPRLGLPSERVLLLGDFTPGASMSDEIERGVSQSRFTLVILSRAFLSDRWAAFGEQLASYSNTQKGRLVPLLREPCDVPVRLQFLVALDFSDTAQWDVQGLRLRRLLDADRPPAVEPSPERGVDQGTGVDAGGGAAASRERPVGPPPARTERKMTGPIVATLVAVLGLGWIVWGRRPIGNEPAHEKVLPDAAAASMLVVAGSVVDSRTNRAVGQVRVELQDGGPSTITDDAGNFRLPVPPILPPDQRRLLRARKAGYGRIERWILPPVENLVLPLEKN